MLGLGGKFSEFYENSPHTRILAILLTKQPMSAPDKGFQSLERTENGKVIGMGAALPLAIDCDLINSHPLLDFLNQNDRRISKQIPTCGSQR